MMSTFKPQVDDSIEISGVAYTFQPHPQQVRLRMVYQAQGKKGTVYHLKDRKGTDWALKVFAPSFRKRRVSTVSSVLNDWNIEGIRVAQRVPINRQSQPRLVADYPDLEHSVLMPWVHGDNWENFWVHGEAREFKADTGLQVARKMSQTLRELELAGNAHCDIAGSNVMIDVTGGQPAGLQLIDIEDCYIPDLVNPESGEVPAGTSGYQHRTSRKAGQWNPYGDRFASAILFAEMLTWHLDEIRKAAGDGASSYFDDTDLESPSEKNEKYRLLHAALRVGSTDIGELFARAWRAERLEACPSIAEWHRAIHAMTARGLSTVTSVPRTPLVGVPTVLDVEYVDNTFIVTLSPDSKGTDIEYQVAKALTFSDPVAAGRTQNGQIVWVEDAKPGVVHHIRLRPAALALGNRWGEPFAVMVAYPPTFERISSSDGFTVRWECDSKKTFVLPQLINPKGEVDSVKPSLKRKDAGPEQHEYFLSVPYASLASGTYRLRIRQLQVVGFSAVDLVTRTFSFDVHIPLPAPKKLTFENGILEWSAVAKAQSYRVDIFLPDGSSQQHVTTDTHVTQTQLKIPADVDYFTASVSGQDPAHGVTGEAIVQDFKLAPKSPQWARKKTDVGPGTVTLRWNKVSEADSYVIEWKSATKSGTVEASAEKAVLYLPAGRYVFTVAAVRQNQRSVPSAEYEIEIPAGELKVNVSTAGLRLDVTWQPVLGATKYTVLVGNTEDAGEGSGIFSVTDARFSQSFSPGTYEVYVDAENDQGAIASSQGTTIRLALQKPAFKHAPDTVVAGAKFTLEWDDVEGASRYVLHELRKDEDTLTLVNKWACTQPWRSFISFRSWNTVHAFQVQPFDSNDNAGELSDIHEIQFEQPVTESSSTSVAAETPEQPIDESSIVHAKTARHDSRKYTVWNPKTTPTLNVERTTGGWHISWSSVPGATHYDLSVRGPFSNTVRVDAETNEFTLSDSDVVGGVYTVSVTPYSEVEAQAGRKSNTVIINTETEGNRDEG
ncbi:MAG: hypothetical protein WA009_01390 [Phototrophicaceae bacterium]